MIRVIVKSAAISERSGKKKGSGEGWSSRQQVAWIFYHTREEGEDPFPTKLVLRLGENQRPYPVGDYLLAPYALCRGDFDSVRVGWEIDLIPAAGAAKLAA